MLTISDKAEAYVPKFIEATKAINKSLRELVDRRTEICLKHGGNPDGSDGRYKRAREALSLADEVVADYDKNFND